jgi:hypothetical protein
MSKIVGNPVTRGQANETVNQIENTFKECGVDPQQTLKRMLNKKAFRTIVLEWLKTNDQMQVVSEKFDTTEIVVSTVAATGNTYNIKKDIDRLVATKEKVGGYFDWVDPDIAKWFGDVNYTDTELVSGRVQLFKNAITHRDIIAEGETLGIYEEYELGAALLLASQLVTVGAIEKPGYGIIIYLKERKDDTRFRLYVHRDSGGKLKVDVDEVNLAFEWLAGRGVLFSN